jgi:hypothetical protein
LLNARKGFDGHQEQERKRLEKTTIRTTRATTRQPSPSFDEMGISPTPRTMSNLSETLTETVSKESVFTASYILPRFLPVRLSGNGQSSGMAGNNGKCVHWLVHFGVFNTVCKKIKH